MAGVYSYVGTPYASWQLIWSIQRHQYVNVATQIGNYDCGFTYDLYSICRLMIISFRNNFKTICASFIISYTTIYKSFRGGTNQPLKVKKVLQTFSDGYRVRNWQKNMSLEVFADYLEADSFLL